MHILTTDVGREIGRDMALGAQARSWQVTGTARQTGCAPYGVAELLASLSYAKSDRIAYRAAKAAVNKVMQSLATDLHQRKIAVALIDPGWVRTDMGRSEANEDPARVASRFLDIAARLDMTQTGQFLHWTGRKRDF